MNKAFGTAMATALLLAAAPGAQAEAPGGPDCGWGNMLLAGNSGLGSHLSASLINGTSGNATFGMTLGTNGCSVDGQLTYGGDAMVWFDQVIDEYSTDVAQGEGDALNAVAVMFGVAPEHREHFGSVMHANFATLFPDSEVTSQQVLDAMVGVMREDLTLSSYVV